MIKWLGPVSSKHATIIRAANAMNSSTELQRIWERLDDRYRAPKQMYDAIKNKLNNIPPKNKDPMRLNDLSNVVSEI